MPQFFLRNLVLNASEVSSIEKKNSALLLSKIKSLYYS